MIAPAWKTGSDGKIDCYYTKNPSVVKKISGFREQVRVPGPSSKALTGRIRIMRSLLSERRTALPLGSDILRKLLHDECPYQVFILFSDL